MDIGPSDNATAAAEAYLHDILVKVNKYMRTRSVWKQDELKYALNRIINKGSGEFCCILGGVSTGKSLVLSELTRSTNQSVALVDMRDGNTILGGLICSLERDCSAVFYAALLEVVKALPSRFSVTDSSIRLTYSSTQDDILSYFLETDRISDARKLGLILSEVAKKSPKNAAGCGLTLIIDQANIAFTDKWGEDARRTLALFVGLTKVKHEVS